MRLRGTVPRRAWEPWFVRLPCPLARLSVPRKGVRGTVPHVPDSPLLTPVDLGAWFRTTPFCNACANRAICA